LLNSLCVISFGYLLNTLAIVGHSAWLFG